MTIRTPKPIDLTEERIQVGDTIAFVEKMNRTQEKFEEWTGQDWNNFAADVAAVAKKLEEARDSAQESADLVAGAVLQVKDYVEDNFASLGTAATRDVGDFAPMKSERDSTLGTLIKTDIDRDKAWLLHITGNSYKYGVPPFHLTVQGYDWGGTSAYNGGGISLGRPIEGLWSFYYENKLCFWIPYEQYWQGYSVSVFDVTYQGVAYNQVVSITNQAKPTDIVQEADLIPLIKQALNDSDMLQSTGQSTSYPMSQNAVTNQLATKAALNASATVQGGIKLRQSGSDVFITTNGSNP